MTVTSGGPGTIDTDETLFAVIDELHAEEEIGVSELANRLGFSKSAVHKHLKTLENHDYVHNDDGMYRLSLKFLSYGGKVRDRNRLYDFGSRKVKELAEATNELIILSVKEFDRGVFLFRWNDQYNLKETIPLGKRFYLHQNAAGKAMLAELPDKKIDQIVQQGLPQANKNTIVDEEKLRDEIRTIREQGFAVNLGERDREVSAVSAAVHDTTTGSLGAISVSLPSNISEREDIVGQYAEPIMQTASKLSLRLKHD